MTNNYCPCYQCKDRTITCHATCPKYAQWEKDYHKRKKALERQRIYTGWAIEDEQIRTRGKRRK